jgi:hypothetical protein
VVSINVVVAATCNETIVVEALTTSGLCEVFKLIGKVSLVAAVAVAEGR